MHTLALKALVEYFRFKWSVSDLKDKTQSVSKQQAVFYDMFIFAKPFIDPNSLINRKLLRKAQAMWCFKKQISQYKNEHSEAVEIKSANKINYINWTLKDATAWEFPVSNETSPWLIMRTILEFGTHERISWRQN